MEQYQEAEEEIRNSVINISNRFELSQKDTVAILTYLIHNILSIREEKCTEL